MNLQRSQLVIDSALLGQSVETRLSGRPAIVLERIARGGGSANWYYCTSLDDLHRVAQAVQHGSVVSFFFDDRVRVVSSTLGVLADLLKLLQTQRDVVVGVLNPRGHQFDVEYLSGEEEIREYLDRVPTRSTLMYGSFPGRDNDGLHAMTLTIPDSDGVIRNHPH